MSDPDLPADPSWADANSRELDEPDIVTAEPPRGFEPHELDPSAVPDDAPALARPVNWRLLPADEAEQE